MARPIRIEYPGAYYHVTSRGNERKTIFRDPPDRRKFLDLLSSCVEQFKIHLHAYVLMNNHYHLLVETPEGELSRAIRYLNGVYTQYFNRRHRRVGHLYQGRYKAILIDKDSYLVELSRYIHLNPYRMRVGSKEPFVYRWSSLRAFVGKEKAPPWLIIEEILGSFGRKRRAAQRSYAEFVRSAMRRGVSTPWTKVQWQSLLGSKGFVEEIEERFLRYREGELTELSGLRESRRRLEAEQVLEVVCRHYRITKRDLSKRSHGYTEARQVASYFLRRYSMMTLKEIGRKVGLHYSTVGNVVRELEGHKDRLRSQSFREIELEIKKP